MNTILYIMRHADKRDELGEDYRTLDDLSINKAIILTAKGEAKAKSISEHPELQQVDTIWVSDYVRTMQTGKYIAETNKLLFNIHPGLGERVKGKTNLGKYEFAHFQWQDPHYKTDDGESRHEVNTRMHNVIMDLLKRYQGQRIAVVSHTTSINFWFLNWCQANLETKCMYFKDRLISTKFKIKKAALYKLTFNQNLELIDLEPLTNIE